MTTIDRTTELRERFKEAVESRQKRLLEASAVPGRDLLPTISRWCDELMEFIDTWHPRVFDS